MHVRAFRHQYKDGTNIEVSIWIWKGHLKEFIKKITLQIKEEIKKANESLILIENEKNNIFNMLDMKEMYEKNKDKV